MDTINNVNNEYPSFAPLRSLIEKDLRVLARALAIKKDPERVTRPSAEHLKILIEAQTIQRDSKRMEQIKALAKEKLERERNRREKVKERAIEKLKEIKKKRAEALPLEKEMKKEPGKLELKIGSEPEREFKDEEAETPTATATGVLNEDKKRGWIKLWRKFIGSKYFKDSYMVHIIDYLLLKASHEDETIIFNSKPLFLGRGELIFGYEAAHRDTGIPIKKLRRRMRTLETDNPPFLIRERPTSRPTIGPRSAHERAGSNEEKHLNERAGQRLDNRAGNFSIISICNYEHYQGSLGDQGQAQNEIKGQAQNGGKSNSARPTKGQPQGSLRAASGQHSRS